MQGGAAHKKLTCTGFLLDGDNGDRSFMSDEVIITRMSVRDLCVLCLYG
jgi:hypothetical protein